MANDFPELALGGQQAGADPAFDLIAVATALHSGTWEGKAEGQSYSTSLHARVGWFALKLPVRLNSLRDGWYC